MLLPNFLIVGAEKCGTTTLAQMLAAHPDVFLSDPKEPRFFSHQNWERGLDWYAAHFAAASGHACIGEASPAYTWAPTDPEVPGRIHDCLGDIRYLYIVRDPVARVASHVRHAIRHRWIPHDTSVDAALELRPVLVDCSRYGLQVERYAPFTQREQWHFVVLEELTADPKSVFAGVCDFLGIERADIGLVAANVADDHARPPALLQRMRGLQNILPAPIARQARRFANALGKKVERVELPAATRQRLVAELRPDLERFSAFVGRDLAKVWGY